MKKGAIGWLTIGIGLLIPAVTQEAITLEKEP